MSYHVKPEDVPEELQNRADTEFSTWYDGPVIDIAAILNAAIEAGLVSPPCYCGRKSFGGVAAGPLIEHEGIPILWAPGANPVNVALEKWKGQTK